MQKRNCNVLGYDITLGISSAVDTFRADTYESKEPETLQWIVKYFKEHDTIYDIGANIGLYSLFAAKFLNKNCTIYAIEPESQNFASLNNNVYINGFSGSIIPCCLAMTDKITFDILNLHPFSYDTWKVNDRLMSGPAMHSFGCETDYKGNKFNAFHKQGVFGCSVDELWRSFSFEFPNHIKIDVDGLELAIVRGMEQTLKDERLKTILIEISENEVEIILPTMLKNGFVLNKELASLSKRQVEGTQFSGCYNAIFYRR